MQNERLTGKAVNNSITRVISNILHGCEIIFLDRDSGLFRPKIIAVDSVADPDPGSNTYF
jgi:hypothetical protein